MDTRWKKFRNNTPIKVIAFLLACVFAFFAMLSAINVVWFSASYGNRNDISMLFTGYEDSSVTNSKAFSSRVESDITAIAKMFTEYKNDENVISGKAFESREAELKKQLEKNISEAILNNKKQVIDNAITYNEKNEIEYRFEDGSTTRTYTTAYDMQNNDSDKIVIIDSVKYYRGFPLDSVVIDEAEIRENYENQYKKELNSEKIRYRAQYEEDKENIKSLKNLKYAVRNRATGELFTNMGADIKADTSFSSLVSNQGWNMAIENGNLASSENVYNQNYYYGNNQMFSLMSSELDEKGFDAYFKFPSNSKSLQKGDAYYDMQSEYQKRLADVEDMRTATYIYLPLMLAMIVFLCIGAGKLDDEGKTIKAKIDKVYNELHLVISAGLIIGCVALVGVAVKELFISQISSDYFMALSCAAGVCASVAVAVFTEWLMSVVRHVRSSTYLKHTLIYSLFIKNAKRLASYSKNLFEKLKELLSLPKTNNLKTKMLKIVCIYAGANLFLAFMFGMATGSYHDGWGFVLGLMMVGVNLSFISTVRNTIKALDDMMEALIQAENGKFDFNLNVYSMPMYLRGFATHILNLREGMKSAVDEAIKGERMKAELITNVSHDLKTPLTSIVNYVDLLKRCELKDEAAKGYVTILEEKAERLKKLIEDLVEASKVSTGNVQFNITKVNLNELAAQLAGENEEELKQIGIEMRMTTPDSPPIVKADSQKAYRAIENLFSNVKKYAMPGTRVYIEVGKEERYGYISVKNISRDALDVPVEQLTQRFVRGDEARTSEGSGLGLSIADNLITLQNGEFDLELDGDLFKATVRLPLDN